MLEEAQIAELDRDPDLRAMGRSAAIRAAISTWLGQRRREATDRAYREGYAAGQGLGPEWSGWDEEGEWPAE